MFIEFNSNNLMSKQILLCLYCTSAGLIIFAAACVIRLLSCVVFTFLSAYHSSLTVWPAVFCRHFISFRPGTSTKNVCHNVSTVRNCALHPLLFCQPCAVCALSELFSSNPHISSNLRTELCLLTNPIYPYPRCSPASVYHHETVNCTSHGKQLLLPPWSILLWETSGMLLKLDGNHH